MSDYKRLTDEELNDFTSRVVVQLEPTLTQQVISLILELTEYRTRTENGTLIELQDKEENLIGQQVYAIDICSYPEGEVVTNFEEDEDEIIIGFTSNEIVTVNTTRGCNMYHKNGLWFLTKAKAQKKLEELRGRKMMFEELKAEAKRQGHNLIKQPTYIPLKPRVCGAKKRTCKFIHHKDILTLVNELESENAKLKQHKRELEGGQRDLLKVIKEFDKENQQLKAQIAELEKEIIRLDKVVKHNQELIEDGKLISSEQLKQFAERLKEQIKAIAKWYDDHADKTYNGIREKDIDETLEEFLNR